MCWYDPCCAWVNVIPATLTFFPAKISKYLFMSKNECLFFRIDYNFIRIDFKDILYSKRVKIIPVFNGKKGIHVPGFTAPTRRRTTVTLFCRVHRSFMVYIDAVTGFNYFNVMLCTETVPLALSFRDGLISRPPVFFSDKGAKSNFSKIRVEEPIGAQ